MDAVLDRVETGRPRTDLELAIGSGVSPGKPLLSQDANNVTIDTGAALFRFRRNGFAFLDEAFVGGVQVVKPSATSGLNFRVGPEVYSSRYGASQAVVNRNGPACAQVDIYGEAWNASHSSILCSYVCSLTAYAASTTLSGRVTVIAGHQLRETDLLFDSAHLECGVIGSSNGYDCAFTYEGGTLATSIATADSARTIQYQTARPLDADTRRSYYPGLPKSDAQTTNTSGTRILTGNRIVRHDGGTGQDVVLHYNSDASKYPMYLVGQMTAHGSGLGVTALAKWSPTQFPMAVQFDGDGTCVLKLWPDDKPTSYGGSRLFFAIPYRCAESREFSFGLHNGTPPDMQAFGAQGTFPVLGRYTNFAHYGIALYREQGIPAPSLQFQDGLYRWMGLLADADSSANLIPNVNWKTSPQEYKEVVFLEQNRTGGTYNQDFAERQLLDYLRFGRAGAWLRAASDVNYVRCNHFRHQWQLGCDYLAPPVSTGYYWVTSRNDSDVEHDWWRSVRLYARLTGDQLLRREFLDHARIFPSGNGQVMYYRFHVKSLEETALAYSMARYAYPPLPKDPCNGLAASDVLYSKLAGRLTDWFARRYDIGNAYQSEGWVLPEGSLIPNDLVNPWQDPGGFPQWGWCTYMDRGVRHDGCYDCLDPGCRSTQSQPYGRRAFHEWMAAGSLTIASSVLPQGDPLNVETFLRLSQIGFSTMSILHWAGQPRPCATLPYLPAYAKEADSTHIWLPPPCSSPGYDEDGPFQPRIGDGHLGYPYVGECARAVIVQYALTGATVSLEAACTKFHEVLAAQRFRKHYGDPCSQDTSYENSYFAINIDEPGHWSFLSALARYGASFVHADFPAYNPEAKYYR
ncbi:MAG: hypothetical protein U1E76_01530 [Planctomycetota bacterium]